MRKEITTNTQTIFEKIKRTDESGTEFWTSRDLFKVFEYSKYLHFEYVIQKAKES